MKTRAELKAEAKEQIRGNVFMAFVCWLIVSVILVALNFIVGIGTVASIILSPVLLFGFIKLFYDLAQGEKIQVSNVFSGFSNFGNVFVTNFLVGLFTSLWSLLFVIPGIIKTFSYSMSNYVLCDYPELSGTQAIKESQRIMDGHKMDLFVLYLSFIPWALLGTITLGLAYIYIIPYMQATVTNFYNDIKTPMDMGF